MMDTLGKIKEVPLQDVMVNGGFWEPRQLAVAQVSLRAQLQQLKETGRLDTFKLLYTKERKDTRHTFDSEVTESMARIPHHYWDSDVAKWIEAVSYSLQKYPAPELEQIIDGVIDDMQNAQWEDGYLNSYFSQVAPKERFTNVYVMHELYCAGHMLEGAIAYFLATGKHRYLDIMMKYIDLIDSMFGPEEGKIHGYPGHQEIELALVKLYRLTKNEKYLRLSKYFIDERGRKPYFFDQEIIARGKDPAHSEMRDILDRDYLAAGPYALFQSHLPVREQKTAEGHAVRMMYQACAMADLADETCDPSLLDACKTLWDNVTLRRMYITGGICPLDISERFCFDYHLPNESAYNETCATIGLVMWARRMLRLEPDRKYADVMEKALYNGVISGISLEGDHFFYANHLANNMGLYDNRIQRNPRMLPWRQQWFPVSCCPPNIARLTCSIGEYVYGVGNDGVYVHLYIQNEAKIQINHTDVVLSMQTDFPWADSIILRIAPVRPAAFHLNLRIPGWCSAPEVSVNGESLPITSLKGGYLQLDRTWQAGDELLLRLPMEVRLVEAHPAVSMNCGKAAITYGPLVYCLEEIDNGANLSDMAIDRKTRFHVQYDKDLLNGVKVITATARRRSEEGWENTLYRPVQPRYVEVPVKAVPYYSWSNRKVGEMAVWINLLDG